MTRLVVGADCLSLEHLHAAFPSVRSLRAASAVFSLLEASYGTSLVVQWLRLHAPNAGGPGSIPGQGTRSHMHAATKKIPHPATNTRRSQIK